jgi:hypothetical protein
MRRWLRSELPLVVVVVYLPRIQILVGRSWAGTTLKGWPFGLSGRGSENHLWPRSLEPIPRRHHCLNKSPSCHVYFEPTASHHRRHLVSLSLCKATRRAQRQQFHAPLLQNEPILRFRIDSKEVAT